MSDLIRHALRAKVRAPEDTPGTFEAVVLTYGVEDDYGTVFDPGCFAASLAERLPRITWSHNWADVIGRWVDYTDTPDTLTLIGELDDFEAVPRARQAYAQLKSGTIDQFSVGFRPHSDRMEDDVLHFVSATLDEAALVLAGAVPGTKLVAVRSAGLTREVPIETLVQLAKQVDEGKITQDEAQKALDLAAGTTPAKVVSVSEQQVVPSDGSLVVEIDPDDVVAAEEALAEIGL